MSFGDDHDPEDMFAHTKMSFWDHIEELRAHMWRAVYGFLIAMCVGLAIGKPMENFIAKPVEEQLQKFYDDRLEEARQKLKDEDEELVRLNKPQLVPLTFDQEQLQQLAAALGQKAPVPPRPEPLQLTVAIRPFEVADKLSPVLQRIGRRPTLATLSATEAFMVYFKVSIYCGIVLASPWIFYQMWSFVAAGLYPHEKRLVNVFLPFSVILFLAGVALAEFFAIPKALEYLLGFNKWMNLEPDLRLSEWLSFAILTPLVFGVAFQLPLIMLAIYRVGVVDVDTYRSHRRIAIFLMAVLAAILAPSADPISMMTLAIPLWCLYELGILICRWSPRSQLDLDVPESEEMIEV